MVDDDTTPLVSSSYINESCIYVCELCRSGAIVAHGGTTDSAKRHEVTISQDENSFNFVGPCCSKNGPVFVYS